LRNGSQIFKKWSEMVLTCWGFHKNVSRETFLVQEKESRIVADAVTAGHFQGCSHQADTWQTQAPNHRHGCAMTFRGNQFGYMVPGKDLAHDASITARCRALKRAQLWNHRSDYFAPADSSSR
jgi:hypothetical protein